MNRSRSVRRRLSRVSDMLPSVYEPLGTRLSLNQDRTTYRVLQSFVSCQTHDQPAGEPMGVLFQPRHVIFRPYGTRPGHQFVRSPEGWRKLICRKATLVQVEKLAGLAEDGFNLHQDQTLLIDPTLCSLKEREEVPFVRGEPKFQCRCFGHWAPTAEHRDESSNLSRAVMRNGFARSLRQSRFRFQMVSSNGVSSDCLVGCVMWCAAAPVAKMKSSARASEGSSAYGTGDTDRLCMLRV